MARQLSVPGTSLTIDVSEKLSAGGAPNHYRIKGLDTSENAFSHDDEGWQSSYSALPIVFQSQAPTQGMNGVTLESLLLICHDRLSRFQEGPYPHVSNQAALEHIQLALNELTYRTIEQSGIVRQIRDQLQAQGIADDFVHSAQPQELADRLFQEYLTQVGFDGAPVAVSVRWLHEHSKWDVRVTLISSRGTVVRHSDPIQ